MQFLNSVSEAYVEKTMMIKERPNDDIRVDADKGKSLHTELETAAMVSKTSYSCFTKRNFQFASS